MRITLRDCNIPLCNINWGEIFELDGKFYMLIRGCGLIPSINSGGKFVCVDFDEGCLKFIEGTEKVRRITAELVIEAFQPEN